MSRPLGSKNKVSDIPTLPPLINRPIEIPKVPIHYDEILAVRTLRNGRFKGLWELVRLNDKGEVKQVLTDANSRGMIITMMTRQIMKIVVQQ